MAAMDVDTVDVETAHHATTSLVVFELLMKWFAQTPRNLTSRPNHEQNLMDIQSDSHARDYLRASTVASSVDRPAILAIATHLSCRYLRAMRRNTFVPMNRQVRQIDEAIRHVNILNDMPDRVQRIRVLVCGYQVLVETLTRLLNRHPRLRREATQLREEAEDRFERN